MEVTHSEWHYYPGGDVVIQVGNRLYKLHRDILEIHSGFFKDMFSSPSSDGSEGSTEENPLRLPHELCTSKSFTILCRFMYPTKPGALPAISSKDFPIWEPVLETTSALDMLGIQQYILDQFASDTINLFAAPEKLLRWATRFDHEGLLLEGLRTFAYRRLPPSPKEVMALGEHGANVMFTRERIRTVLLSQPMTWLEDEICPHNMCSRRPACRAAILKSIVQNLTISPNKLHKEDMSDIFQVAPDGLCGRCQPIRVELARALRKGKLDNVIQESSQGHAPDHD